MVEALSHEASGKEAMNTEDDKTTWTKGSSSYEMRSITHHKIAIHNNRLRRPVGARSTLGE